MILLIDNYDSFTFNLYQALAGLGGEVVVHRNDALTVDEVLELAPERVVLSPGPGRPEGAGICLEVLERLPATTPLLGVCLGHQSLTLAFGGDLEIDAAPVHGKASMVEHEGKGLFAGLENPLECGRYHSLRAVRSSVPDCLELTAWTGDGLVMGLQHKDRPWHGVQFHPESILTPRGEELLANFLKA